MKEISRRTFIGGMGRAVAGAALGTVAWQLEGSGLVVLRGAEASPIRRIVPLQAHEVPEQITRIIETPQNISLVFWKADRVSVPSEAVAEFEKLKPALLVQSVWSYDEARGDWSNYTVGAPDFANLLKQIPKGETRLFVVANRRLIETPAAPQTPTPTPAGGSEKFPPTQGSDTPPEVRPKPTERITEVQVDALASEVDQLVLKGGFPLWERLVDGKYPTYTRGFWPPGGPVGWQGPIWPGLPNKRVDMRLGVGEKRYLRWLHANSKRLDHELDGRTLFDIANDGGYTASAVGEVLAVNSLFRDELPPAWEILLGWLNSPDHRVIIEDPTLPDFKFSIILVEVVSVDNRGGLHTRFSLDCGGLFARQQGK